MAPRAAEEQQRGSKKQPVVLPAWNRGLKLSAQKPTEQRPAADQAAPPRSPLRGTPGLGGPRRVPVATGATGSSTTPARHPGRSKAAAAKAGSTQRTLHDRLAAAQHPTPQDASTPARPVSTEESPAVALAGLHARFDALALSTPQPQRRSGVSFGSPQVLSYHAVDEAHAGHDSDHDDASDGIITPIGSRNSRRDNVGHTPFAAPWMLLRDEDLAAGFSSVSATPATTGHGGVGAPPSTPATCPASASSFAFGGVGGASAPSPVSTPTLFVDVDTPTNVPGTAVQTPKLHLSARPARVPASPTSTRGPPAASEARQLLRDVVNADGLIDMGSIKLLSPVRATKRVQGALQGGIKVLTPVRRSARTTAVCSTPVAVAPMLEATNFCFMGNPALQPPGVQSAAKGAGNDDKGSSMS